MIFKDEIEAEYVASQNTRNPQSREEIALSMCGYLLVSLYGADNR